MLVEGDRDSREVYVLLQGAVKVVSNTADGTAVLLSVRADGDLIGELASLDGSPRLASVVTIRPCTVRRIGQQAFLDFLRTHPGASLAVSRSVSAKLRNATWHRVEYGSTPVPIRLARLLILLATQHGEATADGTSIHLSLTQSELAALVGAREPTVQRVLRRCAGTASSASATAASSYTTGRRCARRRDQRDTGGVRCPVRPAVG